MSPHKTISIGALPLFDITPTGQSLPSPRIFCRDDTAAHGFQADSGEQTGDHGPACFFSRQQGVHLQLSVLIDEVPLQRVALLIDRTTDEPLLRDTLTDLWGRANPRSPNAGPTARIRFIDLANGYPAAVQHLVQLGDEVITAA
jgi:hypothetical protein